jgi:thiol-disulfide isomerase/thioredoxin
VIGTVIGRVAAALVVLAATVDVAANELKPWSGGDTPPLVLSDLGGKRIDLRKFEKNVVLVNFWATWCAPCIKEMPSLQRLHDQLRARGLVVLAVNMGDNKEAVEKFLRKVPIALPILLDESGAASKAWRVLGLPTSFVLAGGKIRYSLIGDTDWTAPAVSGQISALLPAP